MSAHELLLLVWGEGNHAELPVVVERREDPIIDAEVRMAHVRAFDGSLHAQSHPAEVIRIHVVPTTAANRLSASRRSFQRA